MCDLAAVSMLSLLLIESASVIVNTGGNLTHMPTEIPSSSGFSTSLQNVHVTQHFMFVSSRLDRRTMFPAIPAHPIPTNLSVLPPSRLHPQVPAPARTARNPLAAALDVGGVLLHLGKRTDRFALCHLCHCRFFVIWANVLRGFIFARRSRPAVTIDMPTNAIANASHQ